MLQYFAASAAIFLTIVGYYPYLRDIFARRTKPHVFTWFVWGILTTIGFLGQISDQGGPGAAATGLTALACFGIASLGLRSYQDTIVRSDWLSLGAATLALLLWFVVQDPVLAIVLTTATDLVAFFPTFRKSYRDPFSETPFTFVVGSLKFAFSIGGLNHISILTTLYPSAVVLANGIFIAMLVWRRRALQPRRMT